MKKLDAKLFFWVLIVVNILLIGATLVVFTQASSAGQKKSQKIAQFKADDQANDQLISYYKALQSTLNANSDLESTLQKILPTDKDQSGALADLDAFSKNNKISVQQINFTPSTTKNSAKSNSGVNGVSVLSVSLSCINTPYNNLLDFLKTIESTQRRMQVTSLNISPNSTNPSMLDRIDMTLDIYVKAGS